MRVAVVGAGFGGLAAAALLARRGYEVVVFERRCDVGGRSVRLSEGGFVWDLGPSWYLMPDVYDKFFEALGAPRPYGLVEVGGFSFRDPEAGFLRIGSDVGDLLECLEPGAGERFDELMRLAKGVYRRVVERLLYRSFSSPWDVVASAAVLAGGVGLLYRDYWSFLGRFFSRGTVKRLLAYDGLFLGTPPWELPAVYGLLVSYAVFRGGVFHPSGGFGAVARGIYKTAADLGAEFRLCNPVEKIVVESGRAVGVRTAGGGEERFDAVVVNADYAAAEQRLLGFTTWRWDRADLAPSAYMAVAKLRGEWPHGLHLVYVDSWDAHLNSLVGRASPPENPSFYVYVPSTVEAGWAPEGSHSAFFLIPAPPGKWSPYRGSALLHLRKVFHGAVEVAAEFDTGFFCEEYDAFNCTALGLRHNARQTAWGRPPMRHKKVRGLYFVGQYTHPGVGVPMVLASAVALVNAFF
ncbi:MAG: phytoene desaturase family protein [Pyrobaculum sp.]